MSRHLHTVMMTHGHVQAVIHMQKIDNIRCVIVKKTLTNGWSTETAGAQHYCLQRQVEAGRGHTTRLFFVAVMTTMMATRPLHTHSHSN